MGKPHAYLSWYSDDMYEPGAAGVYIIRIRIDYRQTSGLRQLRNKPAVRCLCAWIAYARHGEEKQAQTIAKENWQYVMTATVQSWVLL